MVRQNRKQHHEEGGFTDNIHAENKTQEYKKTRKGKKVMQQTRFITRFVLIFLESNPLNLAGSAILNFLRSLMVKFSHVRVSFWLRGGRERGLTPGRGKWSYKPFYIFVAGKMSTL